MITLNLPKKQVNAILVALDAEIEMQIGGRPVDWESFPEVAAMLMAYYTTRCEFDAWCHYETKEENCGD